MKYWRGRATASSGFAGQTSFCKTPDSCTSHLSLCLRCRILKTSSLMKPWASCVTLETLVSLACLCLVSPPGSVSSFPHPHTPQAKSVLSDLQQKLHKKQQHSDAALCCPSLLVRSQDLCKPANVHKRMNVSVLHLCQTNILVLGFNLSCLKTSRFRNLSPPPFSYTHQKWR